MLSWRRNCFHSMNRFGAVPGQEIFGQLFILVGDTLESCTSMSIMEYVYGQHCVRNALQGSLRTRVSALLVYNKDNSKSMSDSQKRINEIMALAQSKSIPIQYCTRQQLDRLSDNRPHQNVMLRASELRTRRIDCLPRLKPINNALLLPDIDDPQVPGSVMKCF